MTINELTKAIHENAVAHGWWEGDRDEYEINALVHSEWSEALEEARAGRATVWYACTEGDEHFPCAPTDESECLNFNDRFNCKWRGKKPEGIAVELMDGCIRIFDYLGKLETEVRDKDGNVSTVESLYADENVARAPDKVSKLIAILHVYTSQSLLCDQISCPNAINLLEAAAFAMSWVKKQGLDPLEILLKKHEYNKTRPYKHGKLF